MEVGMQAGSRKAHWQKALARHFGNQLEVLLAPSGGGIVHAEELTRFVSPRQRKAVFRLEMADGRLLKARRFRTAREAAVVLALSPLLDDRHYSRVITGHGTTTLEEWVLGSALVADAVTLAQAGRAGELLGQLHTTRGLPDRESAMVLAMADHLALMQEQVAALLAQQVLSSAAAASALELAGETRPAHFESGLIHGDFCVDNMIVDASGELVLIDNESLCVGPLDFDIARTWCRWPMTDAARRAFIAGYTPFRSLDAFIESRRFWALRALLMSVYVHVKHERPYQPLVAAMLRLCSGAEEGFWASFPPAAGSA